MNARILQQPLDVRIRVVGRHKVLDQVQHQFPADRLVAVDIRDVLNIGLANHVLVGGRTDHHHPQISSLDRFADGVEGGQVGVAGTGGAQESRHVLVIVVDKVQQLHVWCVGTGLRLALIGELDGGVAGQGTLLLLLLTLRGTGGDEQQGGQNESNCRGLHGEGH